MDVTRSQIWETLTKLSDKDVATEKFGGITYVKWMAAHATMMSHFPNYTWEFLLDDQGRSAHFFPDGTAEVRCKISIGEHSHVPPFRCTKRPARLRSTQIPTRSIPRSNAAASKRWLNSGFFSICGVKSQLKHSSHLTQIPWSRLTNR